MANVTLTTLIERRTFTYTSAFFGAILVSSARSVRLAGCLTFSVYTLVSGSTIATGLAWIVTVRMVNMTVLP